MTAFANFVISNYPHLVHLDRYAPNKFYFCCANVPESICSNCPNEPKRDSCNYFTKAEASYLISHFPELTL